MLQKSVFHRNSVWKCSPISRSHNPFGLNEEIETTVVAPSNQNQDFLVLVFAHSVTAEQKCADPGDERLLERC